MAKRSVRVSLSILFEWRKALRLSQEQLAEMSGLTRLTIINLENEKVQANPVTLHKLARGLGVSPKQLLTGPAALEAGPEEKAEKTGASWPEIQDSHDARVSQGNLT